MEIKENIIIFCDESQIFKFNLINNQLTKMLSQGKQIYSFDYNYE